MAARKNITVVRVPKIEIRPLGPPKGERLGDSPRIFDPLPARTPMNVAPKIDGTPKESHARSNFTTPFNLTPKVADEEEI